MQVIFLDGESKSGKTAVGRSMHDALQAGGHTVRLLVAGTFFRHLTALVLRDLSDANVASQAALETAVHAVIDSDMLLNPPDDPSELDTAKVELLVSKVGQLPIVQAAADQWRHDSIQRALDDGIDIALADGRNSRSMLNDWIAQTGTIVALELVIYCRSEVAAARYLGDHGSAAPTMAEIDKVTRIIEERRSNDRNRSKAAYHDPHDPVELIVGTHSVDSALAAAWANDVIDKPRPIRFDNSQVPREAGLETVTELARKAVERLQG